MRYCPTWRHAALLLSLLSADPNPSSAELVEKPGLIVLSDLSALFDRDVDEAKENVPPPPPPTTDIAIEGMEGVEVGKEKETKEPKRELGKDAWEYLSLISAAKQAASHMDAALVVLEHDPASLPLPSSAHSSRSLEMKDALQKLLGHVVTVTSELHFLSRH